MLLSFWGKWGTPHCPKPLVSPLCCKVVVFRQWVLIEINQQRVKGRWRGIFCLWRIILHHTDCSISGFFNYTPVIKLFAWHSKSKGSNKEWKMWIKYSKKVAYDLRNTHSESFSIYVKTRYKKKLWKFRTGNNILLLAHLRLRFLMFLIQMVQSRL